MAGGDVMHALEIEGWMTPEELKWLALQASEARVIVEIGIWKGRSTAALAAHTPGVVFAIDHFQGSPTERYGLQREALDPLKVRQAARLALARYQSAGKLFILELEARKAFEILAMVLHHRPADMIFIDGSHEERDVLRDIQQYRVLLRKGGLLCGHDRSAPGVRKALESCRVPWKPSAGDLWFAYEE